MVLTHDDDDDVGLYRHTKGMNVGGRRRTASWRYILRVTRNMVTYIYIRV